MFFTAYTAYNSDHATGVIQSNM